jgi:hypothetical protein
MGFDFYWSWGLVAREKQSFISKNRSKTTEIMIAIYRFAIKVTSAYVK